VRSDREHRGSDPHRDLRDHKHPATIEAINDLPRGERKQDHRKRPSNANPPQRHRVLRALVDLPSHGGREHLKPGG
jgi:hypothetical protein